MNKIMSELESSSASENKRINHKIGEVYYMHFSGDGSEQNGWRPGIVFSNIENIVVALPLTTSLKKLKQPTHVLIESIDSGLPKDSMALCENPSTISISKIGDYITTLPDKYMKKIVVASLLATGAIAYLDKEELLLAWEKLSALKIE